MEFQADPQGLAPAIGTPQDPAVEQAQGTTASVGSTSVLTPQQRQQLAQANRELHGVLKAGRMAAFNGWTLSVLGGLSVLMGLLGGGGLWVGAGLMAVGWNELQGKKSLAKLDPKGLRRLIWNQALLAGLVTVYGAWSIYAGYVQENPLGVSMHDYPELEPILGDIAQLYKIVTVAVYGTMILACFIFQGLVAWYYWRKLAALHQYLRQTPSWVMELQRALLAT